MNQDQIKNLLLSLRPQVPNFQVILTGKSSRKVHGLYKPDTGEILLHNRNFKTDQELLYTAVHEFAHHVHFCSPQRPRTARSHTTQFWSIFHDLLQQATTDGWYHDVFSIDPEFVNLTRQLKEKYLKPQGDLMKEFGQLLSQAFELCQQRGLPFEDYRDRILGLPRSTAQTTVTAYQWDLPTTYGYDAMKLLASERNPEKRREMTRELQDGASLDQIKTHLSPGKSVVPLVSAEQDETERLKRKIYQLEAELERLKSRLREREMARGGGNHGQI
ncbi:MAG: hypothetical protein HKM05_00320 [Spirochaetales bacterium]|nr:hypothetical protein [Spirochaetales bacterium]